MATPTASVRLTHNQLVMLKDLITEGAAELGTKFGNVISWTAKFTGITVVTDPLTISGIEAVEKQWVALEWDESDEDWTCECNCGSPGWTCRHSMKFAVFLLRTAVHGDDLDSADDDGDAVDDGEAEAKPRAPVPPEKVQAANSVPQPAVSSAEAELRAFQALDKERRKTTIRWEESHDPRFLYRAWQSHAAGQSADTLAHLGGIGVDRRIREAIAAVPRSASFMDFLCGLAAIIRSAGHREPACLSILREGEDGTPEAWATAGQFRIHQWKTQLERLKLQPSAAEKVRMAMKAVDVRLRLDSSAAVIELNAAGSRTSWKELIRKDLKRISEGDQTVVEEAAPLWRILQSKKEESYDPGRIKYTEPHVWQSIFEAFGNPLISQRVVDRTGGPVILAEEPLRWELTPPPDGVSEYRLALVTADGKTVNASAVITAEPSRYLTGRTIYAGPPPLDSYAQSSYDMRIPAAAMESPEGLGALKRLKIAVPDRIRAAVNVEMVIPVVTAKLVRNYGDEWLHLKAEAKSTDGHYKRTISASGEWSHATIKDRSGKIGYDDSLLHELCGPVKRLSLATQWPATTWGATKVTKKFPDQMAEFLRSLPPETELILDATLAALARDPVQASFRLDVSEFAIDWFDVRVVVSTDDTALTPEEEKALLAAKGGWVRLGEKGWKRLAFKLSPEQEEDLAKLGLSSQQLGAEPQRFHALQLADNAARRFMPAEQAEDIRRRAADLQARVTPPVPASITATLRRYQEDGFHFLTYLSTNHFGGVLADDMGLGKTLQTLTWIEWLRQQEKSRDSGHEPAPALVVCPKSVMDNWQAEAERFLPHLRVRIWRGDLAAMKAGLPSADLHVINYAGLRALDPDILQTPFLAAVLDEAQAIKNPSSDSSRAACGLRATHRLALTGTPVENRLLDLWSIMNFAMPGVLGNRASFGRNYDSKDDPFGRRRLSARVRPFLLRRTKGQVAQDLPDRTEEDLFCEMEGLQATLYRAEIKSAQQILLKLKSQKDLDKARFNILTSLLRLRQICCDPRLLSTKAKAGDSAKLEALHDTVDSLIEEGQKVLIFSQFVTMLDLLKVSFKDSGVPIFYLAGDTEDRGPLIQRFQATEGAAIFLISLKAGGFGLNLTAASHVVLFDPWWNPAVEAQAIDRTHRIGQTQKVIAWRLLIKNSVEEKIRQLQKQKASLAEDILGEEKFSAALTLNDLQYLFAE